MNQHLYVIIPCNRKRLNQTFVATLKILSPSIIDGDDILTLGNGYLSINTCTRMSSLTFFDEEGINYIKKEMLEVAKYLKANEIWYVDELTYDEFDSDYFSFENWIEMTHNELNYCTMEYDKDEIRNGRIASIIHDAIRNQR